MPKVTQEHRTARREQILSSAVQCAAREGFHKTTMAHVIAASGLSAGAVYGYFKGKNELIRAIAERAAGGFSETLTELATREEPVTPAQALEVVLARVEEIANSGDVDVTRVALQAWAEAGRDAEVAGIVRTQLELLRGGWKAVLQRAQRDGTLAADADLDQLTKVLLGLMPGFVLQRLIIGDVDSASYAAGFAALTVAPVVA